MIDISLVREDSAALKDSLKKRGVDEGIVKEVQMLDELWRKTTQKLELLQAESNSLSKDRSSAEENREKLSTLKGQISEAREKSRQAQQQLQIKLLAIPNLVNEEVPSGDEKNNKVLSSDGEKTKQSPPHEEFLTKAGQLDLETAAIFSGSRFRYLIGEAAVASRKLFQMAIDFAQENGFTFVIPPSVAKKELMEGAGFFPSGRDDTFLIDQDQYLTGTSEPLLLALAANKKHRLDQPLRFVGFSSCFRKEAGSYGKDVKGMFRVHQFDKVEMVSITKPEESAKEHQFLIDMQKKFVKKFQLPFQEVLLSAGDQSQIAAKQVDIECWFPSQQRYRETHSASNCTDYQSRLLKIKTDSDNPVFAHTLNATLATERLLLAIAENNVTQDGVVDWPKELIN